MRLVIIVSLIVDDESGVPVLHKAFRYIEERGKITCDELDNVICINCGSPTPREIVPLDVNDYKEFINILSGNIEECKKRYGLT